MLDLIPIVCVLVVCVRFFYGAFINDEDLYHGRRIEGLVSLLGRTGTRIFFLLLSGSGIVFSLRGMYKFFV
jgi:hypothetical protein